MRLFIFLSEIFGSKIVDVNDHTVGHLCDITMNIGAEVFPRAEYLIVKRGILRREYARIPFSDVQTLNPPFELKIKREQVVFQKEKQVGDFAIVRDILDQQVVDTNDRKVVRVNDVHLLRVDNQIYLAHVDVGLRGILRRLGWSKTVEGVIRALSPKSHFLTEEEFISWKNTHALTLGRKKGVLRSTVTAHRLARIPTAELADILEDLDVFEKLSLFRTFGPELQRKVFTDMTLQEKEELIDQIEEQEAVSLLEQIPADEATDLLKNLPRAKRMQLLHEMHTKTSRHLRRLLAFARESAGGLMTTEYLYLPQGAFVKDAVQKLKDNATLMENLFFIYLVDEEHRLTGITSLRRYINADPESPLWDTCYPNKIFVKTDAGMEEVALMLEKYKLSSVPVVDENDVLQGIITIDDVLEEMISLTWAKYKDQL